jgi:hypothetical protein
MFTLFFGGTAFAPGALIEGESAQSFLQQRYIEAICQIARRLQHLPNVIGYGTMNEPLPGYIGWKDLSKTGGVVALGACPTGLQGMALGEGFPQEVATWEMRLARIARSRSVTVNPAGRRAWRTGCDCIWRKSGVWDVDEERAPRLLKPDYFAAFRGRAVDFTEDFYRPFAERFSRAIRAAHPGALVFVETEAFRWPPQWHEAEDAGLVFAPHWYDELVLAKKRFFSFVALEFVSHRVVIGRRAIRRSFARQLTWLRQGARERLRGAPTVLAEFGIPIDMNTGRSYRSGNFRAQERALDRDFRAVEDTLLACAVWNYCPDNTNERGDQWNGEDFSLYSRDRLSQSDCPDAGARAIRAFLRPYPRATAGTPLSMVYDMRRGSFVFRFRHDPSVIAPTEIFLPRRIYGPRCRVWVSDGEWDLRSETQTLVYRHESRRPEHELRVRP